MNRKISLSGTGGSVTVDQKEIVKRYNKYARPLITVGFDDGFASDYTIAFPILQHNGIRGTSWVNKNRSGYAGQLLTDVQMKEMADAGHEMACHTVSHLNLTDLTEAQIINEFKENKAWIESITGKTVYTHVYPYGGVNDTVANLCGAFYEGARSYDPSSVLSEDTGYYMPYGHKDLYRIPGQFIENRTVALLKSHVDDFLTWCDTNGGGLYVLTWHKIYGDSEEDKPDNRWTESQFQEMMEYLSALKKVGDVDVIPFYESVRRIQHYQYADLDSMPQY